MSKTSLDMDRHIEVQINKHFAATCDLIYRYKDSLNPTVMTLTNAGLDVYYVTRVFVPIKHRRKGYGRQLMQKVIDIADHCGVALDLDVSSYGDDPKGMNDKKLVQFYQKFGFILSEPTSFELHMYRIPTKSRTT